MRIGKYHDALPYFPDWERKAAVPYIKWLDAANSTDNPIDKSEAIFQAALIERKLGRELFGDELIESVAPDSAQPGQPFVMKGEFERLGASRSETSLPHSYRAIATDEAVQAADLLPPRSQAFAAVLCYATGWMRPLDKDKSNDIYQRYVQQGAIVPWADHYGHDCPEPDFQAAKHFWLTHALFWSRRETIRHWRVLAPVGALLILALGTVIYRFRYRSRHGLNPLIPMALP